MAEERVTMRMVYEGQDKLRDELTGAIRDGVATLRDDILRYIEALKENAEREHEEFRQRFDQIEEVQRNQGTAISAMQTLLSERSKQEGQKREERVSRDREILKFALTVIGTLATTGILAMASWLLAPLAYHISNPTLVPTVTTTATQQESFLPQVTGAPTAASTATPTSTQEPDQTGGGDLPTATPTARPTPTRVGQTTPDATVGARSNCVWTDAGAHKPDPPLIYVLTKANVQNVRDAPALRNQWGKTIGTIARFDAAKKTIQYPVYWQIGDWIALDNTCTQWIAAWLGQTKTTHQP